MLNKYSTAGILLLIAAAVFIAVALISRPGDITTVAFVIAGMVCAIIGIFTLTFSAGEPVDPRLVGLLPAQGSLTVSRLIKHLGIQGNAYFLPPRVTGEATVFQFNPTLTYDGKQGSEQGSFKETGPPGLVTSPSCDLLIEDLKKRHALVIPEKEEELTNLIRETLEDVYKFAPQVSVRWGGSNVTITFHDYPYIDGCKVIAQKSRPCCSMSPCPACSLCGALIAEGTGKVLALEQCSMSSSFRDVNIVFRILHSPDSKP